MLTAAGSHPTVTGSLIEGQCFVVGDLGHPVAGCPKFFRVFAGLHGIPKPSFPRISSHRPRSNCLDGRSQALSLLPKAEWFQVSHLLSSLKRAFPGFFYGDPPSKGQRGFRAARPLGLTSPRMPPLSALGQFG
jgi:hypothetical protein